MSYESDLQDCRTLMRDGSKSFFAASLVLPPRVRGPATALYAFCRIADDAIDLSNEPTRALDGLRQRLDAVYAGAPHAIAADRALAHVVDHFAIPRSLLNALLEGFAWDVEGRRYETIEAVHDYAARAAGSVGAMMALVMETREPAALARACELGVAMQLTNIARDVGEDARNGRLYLPRQWLREAGVDPDAWLASPCCDERVAGVVARLLADAERIYARAECGVCALPRDCRPAIQAARLMYAEIGRAIASAGRAAMHRRAVVGHRRKFMLMARACTAIAIAPGHATDAAAGDAMLPAVRHLVAAAASNDLPRRTFYQRTLRVLDLFERLEQRQRRSPQAQAL
jgi:phytoene synthase